MNGKEADVEAIMAGIRDRVRNDLKNRRAESPLLRSRREGSSGSFQAPQGPVLYSPHLQFINENWRNWLEADELRTHRPVIGKLILAVKSFVVSTVWKYILGKYFEHERNYQYHLVRFLNDTARYVDERDSEVFNQLSKMLASDIKMVNERLDRLFEIASSERLALSEELEELRKALPDSSRFSQVLPRQAISR